MKKILFLSITAFLCANNHALSENMAALQRQCSDAILSLHKRSTNEGDLGKANSIAARIKSQNPPLTELDLHRCIYYAYNSVKGLAKPAGYETLPTEESISARAAEAAENEGPPFKYPYPAFSASELHASWRTSMVAKARTLCEDAIAALHAKNTLPALRQAMEGAKTAGDNIRLNPKEDHFVSDHKQKILHYTKCYTHAFREENGKHVFNPSTMKQQLTSQYNAAKAKEENARIVKNPILFVATKIYQNTVAENTEDSDSPDHIADVFMATQMLKDPDYIIVCASAAPPMDPQVITSDAYTLLGVLLSKASGEYNTQQCRASTLYTPDQYMKTSGKATIFIKKLAAYATCSDINIRDLYATARNNFSEKTTWSMWNEKKRIAYHAFLWGRQLTEADDERKGLYVFSNILMGLEDKDSGNIHGLYKAPIFTDGAAVLSKNNSASKASSPPNKGE